MLKSLVPHFYPKIHLTFTILRNASSLPSAAVRIVGDVGRNVPAGNCSVESRVERVERLVGVERVRVQIEDVAQERRAASLIRQDHDVLGRGFISGRFARSASTFSNLHPTSISNQLLQ